MLTLRSGFAATAALTVLLLLPACAGRYVQKGDAYAKRGDWFHALEEYRVAASSTPTNAVLDRVEKAERQLAAQYVKSGLEAKSQAKWTEAGDWWRKAFELCPADTRSGGPRGVITSNAEGLEHAADEAVAAKRYEEAFKAFGPLLAVFKDRLDLSQKSDEAHRQFALELDAQAVALEKRGLQGAALVNEVRALRHDPLHPSAFQRSDEFRKTLSARQLVSVEAVDMEDGGWWRIGGALLPRLTVRLGQYPPYGPTKNKSAVPARFVVTVEEFGWKDRVAHGFELRRDASKAPEAGKEKVANPERAAQAVLVGLLESELKALENSRAAAVKVAAALAEAPKTDPKKSEAKKMKPAEAPKGSGVHDKGKLASSPSDEDVQKKREAWQAAQAALGKMPEKVEPAEAAGLWAIPWDETTRVVEARIRFELREPDFGEPVVITRTLRVEAKDRAQAADEAHGLPADPSDLPRVERMVNDLADRFADGVDVIRDARTRRAERLLDQGRKAQSAGSEDEALDAYVAALFVSGPVDFPKDAATLVAGRLEDERLKALVAP